MTTRIGPGTYLNSRKIAERLGLPESWVRAAVMLGFVDMKQGHWKPAVAWFRLEDVADIATRPGVVLERLRAEGLAVPADWPDRLRGIGFAAACESARARARAREGTGRTKPTTENAHTREDRGR